MQPVYELLGLGDYVSRRREVVVPDAQHLVATRLQETPIEADDAALLAADQALVEGDDQQSHSEYGKRIVNRRI